MEPRAPYPYFKPRRAASWWNSLEDILWPQKSIKDKIKRRAEGFAEAGIDTALNFGFHIRFDFSNYFGQLHGYLNNVCEELHKYDIKFLDHYSCNSMERPRNAEDYLRLHTSQRHHVLLHHDPIAAEHAGYAGYRFNDLCQIDVRDGSRGYSPSYLMDLFCHNNPNYLDMHAKYLERLTREVDLDGAEIDDMADYGWLSTCGCSYCLDRFKRDYGHDLPAFEDKSFWGDTSGSPISWGNYDNPVFRDWLHFRTDVIADHVKMIKSYFPDKPLTTCCSSTGPIILNAVSLDLEKLSPHLDFVMLENCGIGVGSVKWTRTDAEALQQKDLAAKMGGAPALALSYTIYDKGGYLGWALSRYWGVVNWSSTLAGRLEEDPADIKETHEIVGPLNNWEKAYSDLDGLAGRDVPEVRLVSNRYCRDNGWRDANGGEHWDRVLRWSGSFVEGNVGYRIVRTEELADAAALLQERTPLVLDGVGCVSDAQFAAVTAYLAGGGEAWLSLPFGTHDERGFVRAQPQSDALLAASFPGLRLLEAAGEAVDARAATAGAGAGRAAAAGAGIPGSEATHAAAELAASGGAAAAWLRQLVAAGAFAPRIRQVAGDARWALRLRLHDGGPALHLMNRALEAIPDPQHKDAHNHAVVLKDIRSLSADNRLSYEIDFAGTGHAPWTNAAVRSPELGAEAREVLVERVSDTIVRVSINLDGVDLYGVVESAGV